MIQENGNKQDTDKHLLNKFNVGAVGCIYYAQTLLIIKKMKKISFDFQHFRK